MAKLPERFSDSGRLLVAIGTVVAAGVALAAVPGLGMPALLGGVMAVIGSPFVAMLERRGLSRGLAVLGVTLASAVVFGGLVWWSLSVLISQWEGFNERLPLLLEQAVARLRGLEEGWRARFSALQGIHITDAILNAVGSSREWFASNAPRLMGDALVWALLSPFVAFVALKDGPSLLRQFYELVPNRYFEETVMVSTKILDALALYVRAKLLEALVVGVICGVGLMAIGAPYAWVLATIAGVTNIIPYLGPVMGAVPALLIPLFDPSQAALLWPILIVLLVANVMDTIIVFPIFVAKVVDLHPLILIGVVMMGQSYYGMIGMLLSVPLAACLKVVGQELYAAMLSRRVRART